MAGKPYCSPQRFAISGYGIDFSGYSAAQLRSILTRASATLDTWVNAPQLPQPFDFRGGTVVGEQHVWEIIDPILPNTGARRVYLSHRPIRSVNSFIINFTNNYTISLPSNNLFVNSRYGYIELVASQPTIVGFPPLGWLFGLDQPVVTVGYDYGYLNTITDDPLVADSPTLFYATYGNWTGIPTIKIDGVTQTSGYSVDSWSGSVKFDTEPTPGTEVSASYVTTLPAPIESACGLIAVEQLGRSRLASLPGAGLVSSIKVAEVAMSFVNPQAGVTRNGVTIPQDAARLLAGFVMGSAA